MSLHDDRLMLAPSLTPGYCIVCGKPYPTKHHVVKRSHLGHDGPQLHLCGHGTAGCHGLAELRRLHFRHADRWEWIATPVPMKYDGVLELDGWRPCVDSEVWGC